MKWAMLSAFLMVLLFAMPLFANPPVPEFDIDARVPNRSEDSSLHRTRKTTQLKTAKRRRDGGIDTSVINMDGQLEWHKLSSSRSNQATGASVTNGANIEAVDNAGLTALHWAAKEGRPEVVKVLLERGAEIEAPDRFGRTALLWASKNGKLGVVQTLIDEKADVTFFDDDGGTPLHWATKMGHQDVVQVLLESRAALVKSDTDILPSAAGVDMLDDYRRTPLHWAAQEGHSELIEVLLDADASLESVDAFGLSPLHWAVKEGHQDAVKVHIQSPITNKDVEIGSPRPRGTDRKTRSLGEDAAPLGSICRKTQHRTSKICFSCCHIHENVSKDLVEKKASTKSSKDTNGKIPKDWICIAEWSQCSDDNRSKLNDLLAV